MASFLASPVWGAVITITGSIIVAIFGLMWRLSSKVDRLSDTVSELGKDIADLKADSNIVRWSDLRRPLRQRRRREF